MARLPTPGSDDGTWGGILNEFLLQEHNLDGKNTFLSSGIGGVKRTVQSKLEEIISVKDFGAVGGGLGTTVADAGVDIATIRTETGQSWLQATDSMDLVAFYRAQVAAEATGCVIYYPKDHYVHTGQAYIHSGVHINGGGSLITSNAVPNSERIAAPFSMGQFGRYDIPRFETEGWTFVANNIVVGDIMITGFTGPTPDPGDVLLIHTTAFTGTSPILPDYSTFNEVVSASGGTITLRWPIEKAMTAPKIVNYNKITVKKSDLVPGSAPHVYYCCAHATIQNVNLGNLNGGSVLGGSAMLDCDIDVRSRGNVQSVYFNGLNRCRVRWAGEFGGARGLEIAVGSALSSIDVDLKFCGDSTDYTGESSSGYNLIQFAEKSHGNKLTGRIDAGIKPCSQGLTFADSDGNIADLRMTAQGLAQSAIAFSGNAACENNTARGMYDMGTISGLSFATWSSGGGPNNWLDGVSFAGTPSANALLFAGPSRGGARSVSAPSGILGFSTGATVDNRVFGSYIAGGVASGTTPDAADIETSAGHWPEVNLIVDINAGTTLFNRQAYGRTMRNAGATAIRTFVLPVAVAGMYLTAVRSNATYALRVDPNGTEIVGTGGSGKYLSLDTDGAFVIIRCFFAGVWTITASGGTISYEP